MRLFIAINVPEIISNELKAYQPENGDQIRAIANDQFHITLHFLGNSDYAKIERALKNIKSSKFKVCLNGLGKFDGRRKSTTLWAGIKHSDGLIQLHQKIAHELQFLEVKVETRKYTPHITMARCKQRYESEKIQQYLKQETIDSCFIVNDFCLYQSELHGDGSRYKVLNFYTLD